MILWLEVKKTLPNTILEDTLRIVGDLEVNLELKHYASPYYDPVKAKEYYERTKQLKGRGTSGMSSTQRNVAAVSKDSIRKAKKEETDKNRDAHTARVEAIREKADTAKQAIQDKLARLTEELSAKAKQLIEESKTLPLNKIPANASPRKKAFLEKQNQQIRAANAAKVNKQISSQAKRLSAIREGAAEQRRAIGEEMRSTLNKVRTEYKAQVDATRQKYVDIEAAELANIRSQVK